MFNLIDSLFTKKTILQNIKIFVCIVFFHFLITTIIRYGLKVDSQLVHLRKDIYIIFIYMLILGYNYKKNGLNIGKFFANKFHMIVSIMISIFALLAIVVSYYNGVEQGLYQILMGLKYDVFILTPIIFIPMLDINKKDVQAVLKSFLKTVKIIILLSFVLRTIRLLIENNIINKGILTILGFGDVGVFSSGHNPPMYYRTGTDGLRRASGIFSGPNNFGFFIVSFLGVLFSASFWKNKLQNISFSIFYFISILILLTLSMSRSGYIATFIILIICLGISYLLYQKTFRNIFIKTSIVALIVGSIGIFTIIKTNTNNNILTKGYEKIIQRNESTKRHYKLTSRGIEKIQENPLGYGLGTVGPAVHHLEFEGLLPENWWIQIAIETGRIGGLLYIGIIASIIIYLIRQSQIVQIKNKNYNPNSTQIINLMLALGLIGLSIEGLVLHSFEDASISLPFFTLIGLTIALKQNNLNLMGSNRNEKIK